MNIYFLAAATKLGQGNVFTGICHSVNRGGLPQCMLGYHTPPRKEAPSPHPPRRRTPPRHTVNERPVRILLECIRCTHFQTLFVYLTSAKHNVIYLRFHQHIVWSTLHLQFSACSQCMVLIPTKNTLKYIKYYIHGLYHCIIVNNTKRLFFNPNLERLTMLICYKNTSLGGLR